MTWRRKILLLLDLFNWSVKGPRPRNVNWIVNMTTLQKNGLQNWEGFEKKGTEIEDGQN
jgi:hypothetical protein